MTRFTNLGVWEAIALTGRQPNFTDDYIARLMGDEPLPPNAQPEAEPSPQLEEGPSTAASPSPWETTPQPPSAPSSASGPLEGRSPTPFAQPSTPTPTPSRKDSPAFNPPSQERSPSAQEAPLAHAGDPATQDAIDTNPLDTSNESPAMQDAIDANLRDPSHPQSLATDPTAPPPPGFPERTAPLVESPQPDLPSTQLTQPSPPPPVAFSDVSPSAAPSPQELMQQLTRYQQQYGEDATQELLSQVLIDFERRYGVSGTRELLLNVIEDLEQQQGPAAAASVVPNLADVESGPPVQPAYPTAVVDFPDPQAQPVQPPPPMVERDLRSVPSPTATGNSTHQNLINLLPLALVAAIAGTALAFTLLRRGDTQPETAQMAQVESDETAETTQLALAAWDDLSAQVEEGIDQTSSTPPTSPDDSPEFNPDTVAPTLPPSLPDVESEEPLEPPYDPSIPTPGLSPSPTPTIAPNTPYPPPATPLPGTQLW